MLIQHIAATTLRTIAQIMPQKSGVLLQRTAELTKDALARFSDPHAVGPRPLIPDETWFSCAPGCCFSTGFVDLFKKGRVLPMARRKADSKAGPKST